jgi:hypothetical protein
MTKEQFDHEMKKIASIDWRGAAAAAQVILCMRYIESLEAENAKLNEWLTAWKESFNLAQAEIAKLKAIAIQWHKYPDEKPIDGRYLFWDSDGNAPHVLPYNDIVVKNNSGVFSTQTHWAYLPAPPKEEEK